MTFIDYLILAVYAFGMLAVGSLLHKRNKSSADMFAVSRQSPWWLSGLSAFMSAFSAGTFVVWGGIAYKQGLVAVSICMCSGVSSFLVGKFLAGRWASLNITSVGEYIRLRFGEGAVQFYTWVGMGFKVVAMAVALYAFATLLSTLIPLPAGHFLADAASGKLSIFYAILLSGLLMLIYAVAGGLWAVLIIDSIQFVVLTMTVLFVAPLCLKQVGGLSAFIEGAPAGFFAPASGKFTFLFLLGWIVVHTFKLGGEWVFIQRFLAVSSPASARRSSYLFGTLYLLSPIVWMLPPMIYRVIDPTANPEQAYFMACQAVLPPGMMGLLLAAMFSSTASYIDGEINVYAGEVTESFYHALIHPKASQQRLLLVGRISSLVIGLVIIGLAAAIPWLGGAEKVVLTITSLLVVSMVLPVLWGLFFGRIRQNAVWISTGAAFAAAALIKFGIPAGSTHPLAAWFSANAATLEVAVGLLVPLFTLMILEISAGEVSPGFQRIQSLLWRPSTAGTSHPVSLFPARILGYSIGVLGLLLGGLSITGGETTVRMLIAASLLILLSIIILFAIKRENLARQTQKTQPKEYVP